MTILRSVVMGVLFLVLAAVLLVVGEFAVAIFQAPRGVTVGVDVVSMAKSFPALWIIPPAVFLLGLYWKYRRAKLGRARRP